MALDITQYQLYKKILDSRNIFNAIFCMESYIFDKGLLNIEEPVKLLDEFGWKIQCKLPPKTKRFCPLVLK